MLEIGREAQEIKMKNYRRLAGFKPGRPHSTEANTFQVGFKPSESRRIGLGNVARRFWSTFGGLMIVGSQWCLCSVLRIVGTGQVVHDLVLQDDRTNPISQVDWIHMYRLKVVRPRMQPCERQRLQCGGPDPFSTEGGGGAFGRDI